MSSFHVIFCAAVPLEVKSLCRQLQTPIPTTKNPVSHGKYKSINVTVLASGVGIERMANRLSLVQPMTNTCWISYGLAGALSPNYQVGDCVFGNKVQYPQHDDLDFTNWFSIEMEEVCLLCSNELVEHPNEKSRLHRETKASLVDMESYAVAVMASNREEPFYWLRGISDAQSDSLPVELLGCLDKHGFPSTLHAIQKVMFMPSLIPKAVQLGKESHKIQDKLGQRALHFLEKLDES